MNMVQRSDVGRVRTVNEDRSSLQTLQNGYTLAIVADGMGGHQAGDTASHLAVETVTQQLQQLASGLTLAACAEALRAAILRANNVIYELASQDMKYHNMGTTIVAVLLDGLKGIIGHIGDSRAYIIKDGQIRKLTDDHSLVNELLKSGQISYEESLHHPRRNVLTRALGTDPEVAVDINTFELEPGSVLLLCSDGLSNPVSEDQMVTVAESSNEPLSGKADRLLELALEAGGDDNITVVLLEQTDNGFGPSTRGETN